MATSTQNIIKVSEPIQQGDTFNLNFQYKENGTAVDVPSGYDMIAALYDRKWNPLQVAKISDGSLVNLGNHVYSMTVTHESSMKMVAVVYLELTIANTSRSSVDHAKQLVEFNFEARRNNNLL